MPPTVTSDFLVLGSGIAGLSLALKASRWGNVSLVTKRATHDSATANAQGGLAIVISSEDSFEEHIHDTLKAGGGLCHEDVVRQVVTQGPARLQDLIGWGVRFSSKTKLLPSDAQRFELGLEGGHSRRRILHVGDYTGHAIEQMLVDRARENPKIRIYEHHLAIDLITRRRLDPHGPERDDACAGAYVLDVNSGQVITFLARATALCTGGAGKVYLYTSNPDVATGDGMALAYRAGACLANMEFVQFHPTCLYHPQAKNFLISEALRGEGAVLKNRAGESFMKKYDPKGELAPRDIVARAIDSEMKRTGDESVLLDITARGAEFIKKRFPRIHERCLEFNIDITAQPIPVVPAAHYFCGGVRTDRNGNTTIPRLSAMGEVSCTGLHGANRLASNSLPEGLVFSHAVSETWKSLESKEHPLRPGDVPPWNPGKARPAEEKVVITHMWEEIRRLMWNYVGIARTTQRLERALTRIELVQQEIKDHYWSHHVTRDLLELRNISIVADLVIRCALFRKESRGLHYNVDFPKTDDTQWKSDTLIRRENRKAVVSKSPHVA
ncbi:MAG TPA: L-aspartate oxidase [Elusimicrobiota bacterium]|nr:L-aspartate oxidase [Elusimicrobiota bacterium]